jgi:hypothetical protein
MYRIYRTAARRKRRKLVGFGRAPGILLGIIYASIVSSSIAGGPYPEPLSSSKEIRAAKANLDSIDIWNLPLADYPLLSKFAGLRRVRLFSREGTLATNEKLKAIADIGFRKLEYIDLNNCRLVGDRGIEALSKVPSLRQLQLEGTAISDAACFKMATNMTLNVVNVANCSGVTKAGLSVLAKSEPLREFRFSVDDLVQDEVLALIDSFKGVAWCEIVDPAQKLDASLMKSKGQEKKVHLTVRLTGALQDMRLKP